MLIDDVRPRVHLMHPNIAQVFDLGRVDGSHYIAVELVDGASLRSIFDRATQRGEPIPLPLACHVVMKACDALDYAHNKRDASGRLLNLIHRDVSPQNILVSHAGEVKLIGFGIATAAANTNQHSEVAVWGKSGYMSPEQVLAWKLDHRTDIFSVGVCLYELLTGQRLFNAETEHETLKLIEDSCANLPQILQHERVPGELAAIVLEALAWDREDRHRTATDLREALDAFMQHDGEPFDQHDLGSFMAQMFGQMAA